MFKPDPRHPEALRRFREFYLEHPATVRTVFLSALAMGIAIGLPIGVLLDRLL